MAISPMWQGTSTMRFRDSSPMIDSPKAIWKILIKRLEKKLTTVRKRDKFWTRSEAKDRSLHIRESPSQRAGPQKHREASLPQPSSSSTKRSIERARPEVMPCLVELSLPTVDRASKPQASPKHVSCLINHIHLTRCLFCRFNGFKQGPKDWEVFRNQRERWVDSHPKIQHTPPLRGAEASHGSRGGTQAPNPRVAGPPSETKGNEEQGREGWESALRRDGWGALQALGRERTREAKVDQGQDNEW